MKKDKHRWNCHEKRKNFTPFVLSVDGIMGKEAQVALGTLSPLMVARMEEPILHVKGWFNGRIIITVARSYYRVICGYRVPSPLRTREPDWESGSGLFLAQ